QVGRAQQFVPLHGGVPGDGYSLQPLAGFDGAPGPVFAGSPSMRSEGLVAGRSTDGLGNIEIGFDYIRPFWTNHDFMRVVPPPFVGNFPVLGDSGFADQHFNLAPHLNFKYDVSDALAIKATGSFMNLTGSLQQNANNGENITGVLTANSSL